MWTRVDDMIGPMWLAIFIIWAITGLNTKRTVGSASDARARISLGGALLGWLILFNRGFRPGVLGERFVPIGPGVVYTGTALTAVGLGFALWARFAIGRNWGRLVTVQEDHQLIRTGPYAIVRHPIYSGFMLATFGTALAIGEVGGLVATALVVICWGYKSRLEERYMIEHFGVEYEQYRQQVKGLIPGIW
jgi:protein-S-isoprenylcysteine O-methyltransferase Ste14